MFLDQNLYLSEHEKVLFNSGLPTTNKNSLKFLLRNKWSRCSRAENTLRIIWVCVLLSNVANEVKRTMLRCRLQERSKRTIFFGLSRTPSPHPKCWQNMHAVQSFGGSSPPSQRFPWSIWACPKKRSTLKPIWQTINKPIGSAATWPCVRRHWLSLDCQSPSAETSKTFEKSRFDKFS